MRVPQVASDRVHILIRIWKENKDIHYEPEFAITQGCQELHLDIPYSQRPTDDWITEALECAMYNDIRMFLPDLGDGKTIEICEEPIFYEVIGEFHINGYKDYYGEYDEEYCFDVLQWTVAIDDKNEDTDYV